MAKAVEYDRYIKAAGNAMPIDMAWVAGPAAWGSLAGAARRRVSDEHYEPAALNSGGVGFDTAGIASNTCRMSRPLHH